MVLCKVCGQGITGVLAVCTRCATPHHKECFDFVESCAIYACGGTRYEVLEISGRDESEVLAVLKERLTALMALDDRPLIAKDDEAPGAARASESVSELLRYKRGLLRELNAATAKAGRQQPSPPQLEGTEEVTPLKAKTFVADELVIDNDPRAQDRKRKVDLLRQMAASPPDLEEGLIARVRRVLGLARTKKDEKPE